MKQLLGGTETRDYLADLRVAYAFDSLCSHLNCLAQENTHSVRMGWVDIPACIRLRQPWSFLWSSMLIFFTRNAMSVRSKGQHPVYKSSAKEGEGKGRKTLIFAETKGHLTPTFYPLLRHCHCYMKLLPKEKPQDLGCRGALLLHALNSLRFNEHCIFTIWWV